MVMGFLFLQHLVTVMGCQQQVMDLWQPVMG
jgi:hypothetical protein